MPLVVIDGAGVSKNIKSSTDGSDQVPHHNVDTVLPGTGATSLGKAEDAAHSNGDVGVMALGVRKDTAAALAGSDADYHPFLLDASGRVWCNVGAITLPAWTGATNIGKAEDDAHASGDVGVMALTVRKDTPAALGGSDGDYQPALTDAYGRVHANTPAVGDGVWINGALRQVKSAHFSGSPAFTDQQLVAGVASNKIRVLAAVWTVNSGTNAIKLGSKGGGASTDITTVMYASNLGGAPMAFNPHGWCETVSGEALVLNSTSGSGAMSLSVLYAEVPA